MKIGFIGVGFMGRHMARHIIDGGHEVTIYDINKKERILKWIRFYIL